MSLNRIPFQLVNESQIEAIVGTQTSKTCRRVGIPAIASTTQRSRPSNWRYRRVFVFVLARVAGGFWARVAVATAAPALLEKRDAPAGAHRRARRLLLVEDGLGLILHVGEDRVGLGGIGNEVRERLTGDVGGELRARVAVEELGHGLRRGDRRERLLLQRGEDRLVDVLLRADHALVFRQVRLLP